MATDLDILEKSGSWYSYQSNRLGQGRENIKQFFKENPAVADEIEAQIRQKLLGGSAPLETADETKAARVAKKQGMTNEYVPGSTENGAADVAAPFLQQTRISGKIAAQRGGGRSVTEALTQLERVELLE